MKPEQPAADADVAALIQDLRREFSGIEPVIVFAPTTRCGSTLLQRAINEGGGAIVYGENFLFVENLPQVLLGNLRNYGSKTRVVDGTLRAFLDGDKGMDASALFPDYARYRRLLLESFYRVAAFYRDESRANGYQRWGFKHQVQDASKARHFLRLIPAFKGVGLYRDALDVARSVRARWPENLETVAQYRELGSRWQRNLRFLRAMRPERMLLVRYEELSGAGQEACLARIEAHLKLPLSRKAFEKKVNAHGFDRESGKPSETYVPPAELPPAMAKALVEAAQPLYGELGYGKAA